MDMQHTINLTLGALLGLVGFLGGLVFSYLNGQLKENRDNLTKTNDKLTQIEVLVAGKYITREETVAYNEMLLKELHGIREDIHSCMLQKRRKDDEQHKC